MARRPIKDWMVEYDRPFAIIQGSHLIKEAKYPHVPVAMIPPGSGATGGQHQRNQAQRISALPDLIRAAQAIIEAHDYLFVNAGSNGVFNRWGDQLDCTSLNNAMMLAKAAIHKAGEEAI